MLKFFIASFGLTKRQKIYLKGLFKYTRQSVETMADAFAFDHQITAFSLMQQWPPKKLFGLWNSQSDGIKEVQQKQKKFLKKCLLLKISHWRIKLIYNCSESTQL